MGTSMEPTQSSDVVSGRAGTSMVTLADRTANPRLGYTFAVLNMVISGVAIFVNSLGVKMFPDSTLYTTLKNAVVGLALLIPLAFYADKRGEFRRLSRQQWGLLLLVALIGGSVAYALDFRGLQVSTAVTASVIDHTQFIFVAILAMLLLRERFGPGVWLALVVLLAGLTLGLKLNTVRWDVGVYFLFGSTLLFAGDFIIMKYLLRSVSVLTVMTFKMTLGALLLFAFVAATGHLGLVTRLSALQWGFVLITGLILLAFTVTSILGLRHASATAVTAIPAASPIITTLLVVFVQHNPVTPVKWLGIGLMLVAVLVIFILGRRRELRAVRSGQREVMA